MSIFVQIVSYKNFDTVPTVLDCLEKASDRQSIRIGLVLQQDEEVPAELNLPNVSIQRFTTEESRGHGWARSVAQAMYNSEDYTMQVDSGVRFAKDWDSILIDALRATGSPKPLITNYANKFNPENGELEVPSVSYRAQPHMFLENVPNCWGAPMKGVKKVTPTRIVSDHFFFTIGSHARECVYDPGLYWSEIDSALSIRSFSLGYDLFNHFIPTVWMNYANRPRHWDDRSDWFTLAQESRSRFGSMLAGSLESFGLGTVRTLKDYERYSGLDFLGRRMHKDAFSGKAPPTEYKDDDSWEKSFAKDYSMVVSWNADDIERCEDYDYWYFAVEDKDGNNIMRQDLRHERDSSTLEFKTNYRKIMFKAFDGRIPTALCIWPVSKSKGWLKKSKFEISDFV